MTKLLRLIFCFLFSAQLAQSALLAQEPAPAQENKDQEVITLDRKDWKPKRDARVRGFRQNRGHSNGPIFGANIVVRPNESVREICLIGGNADIQGNVDRDVVVIGGNATVSGTVQGDVVVIGGALECSGELNRDAVVVMGSVDLSDKAHVGRSAVFIGGPFNIPNETSLGREPVIIPLGNVLPKVQFLKDWFVHGLLLGRLLPFGLKFAWIIAGIFTAVYFIALLVFPRAVKAVYLALEERPVASILSGMLTLVLFAPLALILIISVIGIAVVPFLKIGLTLALLFGKVGVICFLGRSIGRASGASVLQTPLLAFVAGTAILLLAYTMPLFGITVWMLATVFGLGGAVIALSRTFRREEASVPLAPVAVSTLRPGAPAAGQTFSATAPLVSGAGESASGTATATLTAPPVVETGLPNTADTLLLPRAGFWIRFVAAVLDLIPLLILVPILHVFFIPAAVGYFVAMWSWKGTTLGNIIMGLKIVRTDGTPVTFPVALVRCLSCFFSALVLFLGFFWIGWDRNKQGWHDKIAGTVVVRMPKGFSLL